MLPAGNTGGKKFITGCNFSESFEVCRINGEEIVRRYSDMVYKIAMRYTRNQYDAEDVLSDTFLTYFKKERVFDSEEHRKARLIKVTIYAPAS